MSPRTRSGKEGERKADPAKALKLTGRIEASEQTPIHARIIGYVAKVNADLGDRVKKGQVLAEQAVPEREAELKQKEAIALENEGQVQHAQLLLKEARSALSTVDSQIKQAEAGVKVAQAKLDTAKAALERAKKLQEDKVIDAKVVDERASQVELAKAGVDEAEAAVVTIRTTQDGSQTSVDAASIGIKTAIAQRDASRAEAARSAVMLQYAKIVAPFDGVISQRSVAAGKLVGPTGPSAEPLFTLTATDPLRVVVAVSQNDAAAVRPGTKAQVRVGNVNLEGKVGRTAGVLDPEKHTMRVEIELPNSDGRLLPGMDAEVSLGEQ